VATVNPEQIQHFDKMTNNGLTSFTRGYVSEGANLLCLIDLESLLRSLELHH
jgi:chemotaxis signal transduction protein